MFRPMPLIRVMSTSLVAAAICSAALQAQFQNPIQAAKDAYKKAKQQQQQQQQQQQPAQTPSQTQSQSGQKPPGSGSGAASSDNATPWAPPGSAPVTTAAAASAAAAAAAAVKIDPSKMPDVLGVHLGMTAAEALAAAHKAYPDDLFSEAKANGYPFTPTPDHGYNIMSGAPGNFLDLSFSFTSPPGEQRVWKVDRMTQKLHTNRNTLIAALRQKYGKESLSWGNNDPRTNATNDNQINQMVWLYDEQGNHVPMPDGTVFPRSQSFQDCSVLFTNNGARMSLESDWANIGTPWCAAHFVAVIVGIGSTDIVENTQTTMLELPLAYRTARAGGAWLRDYANRMHQEDLQRSKENKPPL